jgi:polysaccharide chain length determinant protein (PEP-CTERM system associated)
MRVTERLASLFIEENLRDREVLVEGTNQFLETQLEDARRRLVEHEARLEEFRRKYAGELPTQAQTNLQVLQNLQLQLQALNESVTRDRDRRAMLERLLADETVIAANAAPAAPAPAAIEDGAALPPPGAGATPADRLAMARAALRALELRLKPEHPDVIRLTRTVQDLEREAQNDALVTPLTGGPPATPPSPAEVARIARQKQIQLDMESVDRQIAANQAQIKTLNQRVATYQQRVEAVPARESELVALTRDYSTLQTIYTNLLEKNESAKLSANLERRQIGEQFKILDPARLPEKPISPNRTQVITFGILGGLGLGLALGLLLEYRDTSVRTDDEVFVSLSLPVLAMIPLMPTKAEVRSLRRRKLALAISAGVTVIAWAGALVWKLT